MAIEKKWPAVAPQLFTVDGSSLGIITIADTAGFKVKQTVVVQSTSPAQQEQLQVKRVISPTQMIVGPLAENIQPPIKQQGNQLLSRRADISSYTVASGAFVFAEEQPKLPIDPKDIIQAVYRQEPGTTLGVEIDDQYGAPITDQNPFQVNIWPVSQIPFTLGTLALPALINTIISGLVYDKVVSDNVDGQETLTFYSGGSPIINVLLTKTSDGWVLNLGSPLEDFLLLEDGSLIEMEDEAGGAILLEA